MIKQKTTDHGIWRKARRPHRCCNRKCGHAAINPGDLYLDTCSPMEGQLFNTNKECRACAETG